MRKKIILFLFCALFSCSQFTSASHSPLNYPWQFNHYDRTNTPETSINHSEIFLSSLVQDDVKATVTIKVMPNRVYRFHAQLKSKDIPADSIGANIGLLEDFALPASLTGTSEWSNAEYWFSPDHQTTEVTLSLRLGFYGSLNKGEAWFRNISITDEKIVPAGITPRTVSNQKKSKGFKTLDSWFVCVIVLWSLIACFLCILFYDAKIKITYKLLPLFTLIIAIKVCLAVFTEGYRTDLLAYQNWGLMLLQQGTAFYDSTIFIDYPPIYPALCAVAAKINHWLGIIPFSDNSLIVFKLIPILGDFLLLLLLVRENPNHHHHVNIGILFLMLTPVTWLIGPMWGQCDSLYVAIIIFAVGSAARHQYFWASIALAVSLCFKPHTLMLIPVAVIFLAFIPGHLKKLQVVGVGVFVFLLFYAPFLSNDIFTPVKLYTQNLTNYPYETINAFNVYFLISGNWIELGERTLFGLPISYYGWAIVVASYLWILTLSVKKSRHDAWTYISIMIFMLTVFLFAPKMHERYLFMVGILGLFVFQQLSDRRWLYLSAWLLTSCALNVAIVYEQFNRTNTTSVPLDTISIFFSIGNFLSLLYLLWISRTPNTKQDSSIACPVVTMTHRKFPSHKYLITIFAIVCVSFWLTTYNLGVKDNPETTWVAEKCDGEPLVTFSVDTHVKKISYFSELGTGGVAIQALSADSRWEMLANLENRNFFNQVKWYSQDIGSTVRELRLSRGPGDWRISEMVFFDKDDAPIRNLKYSPCLSPLFDEQQSVKHHDSTANGMYFDEIYFVRAALEIVNGIASSETTHPPLAKDIMASSIHLFGFQTFHYRFPGALLSVLMTALIATISLHLFRSERLSIFSTILFAFDTLHLTQGRIALIDSYALFFILLSYIPAIISIINFETITKGKLQYLWLLSAIGVGLAISCKWTGIYAGLGLVALFAYSLHNIYRFNATFKPDWGLVIYAGVVLLVPALVYFCAYVPTIVNEDIGFNGIISKQFDMFRYHSSIKDTHIYSSQWYEWPLNRNPMWYFSTAYQAKSQTVIALVNPVICYLGCISFLICTFKAAKNCKQILRMPNLENTSLLIIVTAGLAQYFPWVISPRKLTFIYHFYASVPFLILSIAYVLKYYVYSQRIRRPICLLVISLTIITFIVLYPITSGLAFSKSLTDKIVNSIPWTVR